MWILIEILFWLMAISGVLLALTSFWHMIWSTLITSLLVYLLSPCFVELIYYFIAWLQIKFKFKQKEHQAFVYNVQQKNFIPIIYSQGYNLSACGLERFHPFDARWYERTFELLVDKGVISPFDWDWKIYNPSSCERVYLLHMSVTYLLKLHYSFFISKILELPLSFIPSWFLRHSILTPMLKSTKGTIMAAKMAMEIGWSINLGGGYHHASFTRGEGFCIYPDISIAIKELWEFYDIQRVMIVDLDAH